MSDDRIVAVGLRYVDLGFLMMAVYGNLDLTYEPNLRKAEELHARFTQAQEALKLDIQADALRYQVAHPPSNAEPPPAQIGYDPLADRTA